MTDKLGIIGMVAFAVLLGSFFGYVLSRGELLFAVVGVVIFVVVALVYTFVLGDNLEGLEEDGHHA